MSHLVPSTHTRLYRELAVALAEKHEEWGDSMLDLRTASLRTEGDRLTLNMI